MHASAFKMYSIIALQKRQSQHSAASAAATHHLNWSEINLQVGKPLENVNVISKQRLFLLSGKDPCGWPMRRFLGNPKNNNNKNKVCRGGGIFSICSVWSLTHCHSWNNRPCIQQQFSIIASCYRPPATTISVFSYTSTSPEKKNRSSNRLGVEKISFCRSNQS